MTEERKHAILFAATLLARKRIETMESGKPNFAKQYFVDKAIQEGTDKFCAPKFTKNYCSFAYSALACFRMGMSGSAFSRV